MIKFLIQTIEGKIKHDFSFTLLESIEYQNWIRGSEDLFYVLADAREDVRTYREERFIPVGTVEFIVAFLEDIYDKSPKPWNVPEELFPHAGRDIRNEYTDHIKGPLFVKSAERIKAGACDILKETDLVPGYYQTSEIIDIVSEWRAFVYKGEMVGLQNYSGDFAVFPDIAQITSMIKAFKSAPIAYTLDVGITEGHEETVPIEVHDFFSVGFYGFSDHRVIPFMFKRWFDEFINK